MEGDERYQKLLLGGSCETNRTENLDFCPGKGATQDPSFLRAGAA